MYNYNYTFTMQWTVFWMWAKTTTWSVNSMCVGNIPKGFYTLKFVSPTYTYTSLSKWSKETMYELNLACPNDMYYELNVHVLCGYLSTAGEHICTRFEGVLAACANGFDHRCRPIIVKISYLIHTYVYLIHTYVYLIHTYVYLIHTYTIPQHIQ